MLHTYHARYRADDTGAERVFPVQGITGPPLVYTTREPQLEGGPFPVDAPPEEEVRYRWVVRTWRLIEENGP